MLLLLLLTTLPLLPACHATPRSSRLQTDDIRQMAHAMADSLADRFAQRTPADQPWVVSIDKVQNLSGDVLTLGELWYPVVTVTRSTPVQTLWDDHRIKLVVPPERVAMLRQQAAAESVSNAEAQREATTHVVTATLRSVTRGQAHARTDLYAAEFQMIDLATGTPVWNDRFELKRQALGAVWD